MMKANFVSLNYNDDKQQMHSKSFNIEIMSSNETDEIINELFESFLFWYQINLEELMKDSEFVFDYVNGF